MKTGKRLYQPPSSYGFRLGTCFYLSLQKNWKVKCVLTCVHSLYCTCTAIYLLSIHSVVDCGPLSDPRSGDVDFSSTTFNSKATYSCDKGYVLVGIELRVCQANGDWSGESPTCKSKYLRKKRFHSMLWEYVQVDLCFSFVLTVVDCGSLADPRNGDVDFSSTTFNSKATYSCDKGYVLVGQELRVCQANGDWSGEAPTCRSEFYSLLENNPHTVKRIQWHHYNLTH